jgi:mycothiol synthase
MAGTIIGLVSAGWQLRPAGLEDLPAIVEVFQLEDRRFRGRTDVDLASVREQIGANPNFDADHDLAIAEAGERAVGAAVINPRGANLGVHPDHGPEDLRPALLAWAEERQRVLCRVPYRVGVPAANAPATAMLIRSGYTVERSYSAMVRDFAFTGSPEPARLPSGYRMRTIDPEVDIRALHRIDDRAFRGRGDYLRETLPEYAQRHIASRTFAPQWSRIVETDAGEAAGSVIGQHRPEPGVGHIEILAVDPDHQRRGLARSLLLAALAAIADDGCQRADLDVASDNPRALDLYLGVGMVERERFEHFIRTP